MATYPDLESKPEYKDAAERFEKANGRPPNDLDKLNIAQTIAMQKPKYPRPA